MRNFQAVLIIVARATEWLPFRVHGTRHSFFKLSRFYGIIGNHGGSVEYRRGEVGFCFVEIGRFRDEIELSNRCLFDWNRTCLSPQNNKIVAGTNES